ncbi:MAG TPA: hypothetical protein VF498_05110 [Anaerolineales bacterium]
MIPPDYSIYFMTMAAVGATLFGLIFVAVSITPESVIASSAPLERQAKAITAYVALLNPLIISLFALVPHQQIGIVVISMSSIGLLDSLALIMTLLQKAENPGAMIRRSLFILASFILYGYETYFAVLLLHSPTDGFALYALADLLIIISAFGVIRAWELVGIRQFHLLDWLSSYSTGKKAESTSNPDPAAPGASTHQEAGRTMGASQNDIDARTKKEG